VGLERGSSLDVLKQVLGPFVSSHRQKKRRKTAILACRVGHNIGHGRSSARKFTRRRKCGLSAVLHSANANCLIGLEGPEAPTTTRAFLVGGKNSEGPVVPLAPTYCRKTKKLQKNRLSNSSSVNFTRREYSPEIWKGGTGNPVENYAKKNAWKILGIETLLNP